MRRNRPRIIAGVGGTILGWMVAGLALASAGSGISSSTLVTSKFNEAIHMNSDGVKLQTKGATDVRIQRLVFEAGAFSGWHHHPGLIVVTVESGTLTLTHADCTSETYGPGLAAGAVFVEGGEAPVQATSAGGATAYVTYIAPRAVPPVFRHEDDPPACS